LLETQIIVVGKIEKIEEIEKIENRDERAILSYISVNCSLTLIYGLVLTVKWKKNNN